MDESDSLKHNIIVGVDPAGKDNMGIAVMRQLSDGKLMIVDEHIQEYMSGYDIVLNHAEREELYLRAYDELLREGIGNYRIPAPIPTRTFDKFRPLYGQKRAKALAKRAKAKAHRKASRK